MKSAVIYTSKLGNAKKVAERIAKALDADLIKIGKEKIDISGYDRIIVGSGVYAGSISKAMDRFITENDLKNASLFVTCAYNDDKGADQLEKIANRYGIADAIFFNKCDIKSESEDSKLNAYIKSL